MTAPVQVSLTTKSIESLNQLRLLEQCKLEYLKRENAKVGTEGEKDREKNKRRKRGIEEKKKGIRIIKGKIKRKGD